MKRRLFLAQASPSATDGRGPQAQSRRAFLQQWLVVAGLAAAGQFGVACSEAEGNLLQEDGAATHRLPSLGGAPDSHQGATVAAFVDAVIPGKHRDPEGAPGGIDVGAPALFFDPDLPAAPFVGVLVLVLDATAKRMFEGIAFAMLLPSQRDKVVEQCLRDTDVFGFAVQLAKLAFFASPQAAAHLGYPGSNSGYIKDADFGFGVALSEEQTTDGNWA